MTTLKCIAIDDEPLAFLVISKLAKAFPVLNLVATFDDPISGAEFLRLNPVDLLFIDINMPDINGLQLVRSLQEKPMIIFTTAHKQFALDSYELDAIDYLLKPIDAERFKKAINKAVDYHAFKHAKPAGQEEVIYIRSEYRLMKLNLEEIEYIESMEDYCRIHLVSGKPLMTLTTLKALLEKLPGERFKRIHRSYVIATNKVRSVVNKKVTLQTTELPVSSSYLSSLSEWVKR
ncbi:MAG: LytTR family DNA-binding domain-containing protein [Ferruginibacter sp.]|nr:LytTR family DNA-binding domain-containing protein [Ferruginibacter sp.]